MNQAISPQRCVYFSQGQRLTPEDLNALNDFSLKRSALVSRSLLGASGIVEGIMQSLRLKPLADDPLSLKLEPGIAINEFGDLLPIEEERLIRLSDLAGPETQTYFLQLQSDESLEGAFVDEELDQLKSFKFRNISTRLFISAERVEGAVEIARVRLNSSVFALKECREDEAIEAGLGVIDQRHAPRIQLYSARAVDFSRHQQMKQSLQSLKEALYEMKSRYPSLSSIERALQDLSSLELEIAERNLALSRLDLVLIRSQRSLRDLIEELREVHQPLRDMGVDFWERLFSLISDLPGVSLVQEAAVKFQKLSHLDLEIREQILDKRTDEEKRVLIQQALNDLQPFRFSFSNTHALGGSLFRRLIFWDGDEVFQNSSFEGEYRTLKTLRAAYEQSELSTEKGLFVSPGKLHFNLPAMDPEVLSLLFLKIYKRRGRQEFSLSLNASPLKALALRPHESVDRFLNIAVQIRPEQLVKGVNQLVIDVAEVDLDFGLMALAVYQETTGGKP
ncbi:MAG: hypothetical protein EA369_07420 [Bradymonadales bacterium]|nr:MAG: hypothetical protein EA369_07420 [Bradymonadales bacterium]